LNISETTLDKSHSY